MYIFHVAWNWSYHTNMGPLLVLQLYHRRNFILKCSFFIFFPQYLPHTFLCLQIDAFLMLWSSGPGVPHKHTLATITSVKVFVMLLAIAWGNENLLNSLAYFSNAISRNLPSLRTMENESILSSSICLLRLPVMAFLSVFESVQKVHVPASHSLVLKTKVTGRT